MTLWNVGSSINCFLSNREIPRKQHGALRKNAAQNAKLRAQHERKLLVAVAMRCLVLLNQTRRQGHLVLIHLMQILPLTAEFQQLPKTTAAPKPSLAVQSASVLCLLGTWPCQHLAQHVGCLPARKTLVLSHIFFGFASLSPRLCLPLFFLPLLLSNAVVMLLRAWYCCSVAHASASFCGIGWCCVYVLVVVVVLGMVSTCCCCCCWMLLVAAVVIVVVVAAVVD